MLVCETIDSRWHIKYAACRNTTQFKYLNQAGQRGCEGKQVSLRVPA